MNEKPPTATEAEMEARFAYAGIVLPADRKQGALAHAQILLATTHWLRQPRTAAHEPSNILTLAGAAK
jgi:hypothetical protein